MLKMDIDTIGLKIATIGDGAILTDIELKDGTIFQFIDDYVTIHTDNYVAKTYVGRNPSVKIEKDIWDCDYISVGWDYLLIKPKDIKSIDIYKDEN